MEVWGEGFIKIGLTIGGDDMAFEETSGRMWSITMGAEALEALESQAI